VRPTRYLSRAIPWGLVALQGWLVERLIRQHGRALLERERLDARLDRLERKAAELAGRTPGGTRAGNESSTASPAVTAAPLVREPAIVGDIRAGEYAHYQQLQDSAIASTPQYPAGRFAGAGIVMLAGGPRHYTNAWVCLTMLRRVLGCRLPIQVWYLGPHEMSPRMLSLLERFEVECVDASEVERQHPRLAVGAWECKPYAILHSRFKDVILIDADNVPLIDPANLLSSPEYRATGALFWPDLHNLGREHPIWEICRVPYRDEPRFESGQVVLDKERSWKALHLTLHLNEHSDFYYRYIRGDPETFHLAWRMLSQPFSMPPTRPTWVVGLINPGDANFADVLQQHDFDGRIISQHRTGAKWTAWGENFRVPDFEHEAICLEALEELRQLWDGQVDLAPAVESAPAAERELLRSRYFLYRRLGSDERVLSLLPGERIGDGGSSWEQTWRLELEQDRQTLVLEGQAGDTCGLTRDADGVWRGRWRHHDRVPVELIPLGPAAGGGLAERASVSPAEA
jgi:hypothetical protein